MKYRTSRHTSADVPLFVVGIGAVVLAAVGLYVLLFLSAVTLVVLAVRMTAAFVRGVRAGRRARAHDH